MSLRLNIFDRIASGANRLSHAFNVFRNQDEEREMGFTPSYGPAYSSSPVRRRMTGANERSIVSAVYMRLAMDTAANDIRHVRLDEEMRYETDLPSGLNECLTLKANIDQGARAFKQDLAMTMFDKGAVAVVPIQTNLNPNISSFDIFDMRVGEIVQFMPRHVRVSVWNDILGRREEVTVAKDTTAIIENPFYQVMNEPNSTLQRLIRKLNILDAVDEASSSGKLDLIIQLPYVLKSQARKDQAEERAKDIEMQLKGSKYGIAYTEATEKITQLNRPAENNLLAQIEFLTKMVYGQLGLTEDIFNGSADEATLLNYMNRTIEPIVTAFIEAMRTAFLTKTARTQRQTIMVIRDPFKFVSLKDFAEIADKLSRNEILSSNEIRGYMGIRPSKDPKADQLLNSNINPSSADPPATSSPLTEPIIQEGDRS